MEKYVRVREITHKLSLNRVTIWRWCRDGLFPRPVKLGRQAIGWPASEIDAWAAQRAQEREASRRTAA